MPRGPLPATYFVYFFTIVHLAEDAKGPFTLAIFDAICAAIFGMRYRLCKLPAISLKYRYDVVAIFTLICLK